jgi:hypothetical protein
MALKRDKARHLLSLKTQALCRDTKWAYTARERVAKLLKLLLERQVTALHSTDHTSFPSVQSELLKVTGEQTS